MKKILATLIMLYATAIDGDSIKYNGKEMRLHGIDAPEYHQKCVDENGKKYHCGDKAYQYLKQLLKDPVECKTITIDRYKREIVICGEINKKMVQSGWAISYYSNNYKKQEQQAKKQKAGMWVGEFMRPEFYRKLKN